VAEITVVVAEDHPLFRKGLVDVLRGEAGVRVVAEAGDGEAALTAIRSRKPTLAILDVDMPKRTGLEVGALVRTELPEVAIVFLTMHAEGDLLRQAMALGAMGYVLKESAASDIVACVNLVASGRRYVSAALSDHLVPRAPARRTPGPPALDALTATEREVLRQIAQGKSTQEIARALTSSTKTVENHRSNICGKLKIHGTNALLRYALEHRDQIV
jgi:DNA-binding NarL/FixJ family response regulator